jgi:pimeloyl-ACP methyl ester carboxylesterase
VNTTEVEISALPFEGELTPATNKKFKETIVFVHHLGGSKKLLRRHLDFVNELGFDAVRFMLNPNGHPGKTVLPITGELKFGARHVWAGQIEEILNRIPGKKILYTFSMPSMGAFEAIANRNAKDITGWICDGGPFAQILRCSWNHLTHEQKVENKIWKGAAAGLSYLYFGLGLERQMPAWSRALPKNFPILSIRGEKDPLVPVSAIDEVFEEAVQIDMTKLSLPEGGHLDGLKSFPDTYKPAVEKFLTRMAHG